MQAHKRILIVGDSFSSEQLSGEFGWPALLRKQYNIDNMSAPGIGEYKILQKLIASGIGKYDLVIVSHTSPNRLHCETNPLYPSSHVYHRSDIIFADAEYKSKQNPIAKSLVDYFEHVFDVEYYKFIHSCCCREIDQLTKNVPTLHITHFDWTGLYEFAGMTNFYKLWLKNRGQYSHYNKVANEIIFKELTLLIQRSFDV